MFDTNVCQGCNGKNCPNCDYVKFYQQQQAQQVPPQEESQIQKWAAALRKFLSGN